MKHFNIILCLLISAKSFVSLGQTELKYNRGLDYQYDVKSVFNAGNIVYYGCDFSNSKFTDETKIGDSKKIVEVHLPEWQAEYNAQFSGRWVSDRFKFQKVTENLKSVQDLYRKIDVNRYVIATSYEIGLDKLKEIVKAYDLPEKTGVGFVAIMESLNKPEHTETVYFTFFDINTRNILWTTKMKGEPRGYGFAKYYYVALYDCMNEYYARYVKKTRNAQKK